MKKTRIVFIGGGSVLWAPKILNDISLMEGLQNAEFVNRQYIEEALQKMRG